MKCGLHIGWWDMQWIQNFDKETNGKATNCKVEKWLEECQGVFWGTGS